MAGARRCDIHGGKAPQVLRKAAERRALARAQKTLADLGNTDPVKDPIAALENLAGEALALVDILRGAVSELESIRYDGGRGAGEQIRGELAAYMTAMGRAESILAKIVGLNLDERRLKIQEAQAVIVLEALRKTLQDRTLNLDTAQQQRARALLARELTPVIEGTGREIRNE
jgi:hypothetical protein